MMHTARNINADPARTFDAAREEKRLHRRVPVKLSARFMTPDGTEHQGRITNISAGGAYIHARCLLAEGDPLLLYIDEVGRLEGRVIRLEQNAFVVSFDAGRRRNQKTADTLIWLHNGGNKILNRRAAARIRQNRPAVARLETGAERTCVILDISTSGASIGISPRPAVGKTFAVGRMRVRVVRHHEEGVGVEFITPDGQVQK